MQRVHLEGSGRRTGEVPRGQGNSGFWLTGLPRSQISRGEAQCSSEDSLDAFMSEVRSTGSLDGVERRKLHVHVTELRREAQRLRRLVELTRPAQLPALQTGAGSSEPGKPRKLVLPLFGAMKGGSKFKLKTGTVGKIHPKRADLPPELFSLKEMPPGGEEEEDEEEDEDEDEEKGKYLSIIQETTNQQPEEAEPERGQKMLRPHSSAEPVELRSDGEEGDKTQNARGPSTAAQGQEGGGEKAQTQTPTKRKEKRKMLGPGRPAVPLSTQYPEDDPDYCVWMPPAGSSQTLQHEDTTVGPGFVVVGWRSGELRTNVGSVGGRPHPSQRKVRLLGGAGPSSSTVISIDSTTFRGGSAHGA
ncbi:hypothetical protein SKAU_G00303040 [Synaphobranchus kaupii]|uniref:Uncharacterized protein n=1 Tax=Synaphobranchus kaupii TaxID=118154 RepID=A0A9Q1EW60_SYNKA|nr:hypothetical protein SKAU_G00303040 [Synaphobranchus kaupii]